MNEYEIGLSHSMLFAQSVGIGFLIGLERERHEGKIAGVRTFTLIALLGALGGFIGTQLDMSYVPWILLIPIAASLVLAQYRSAATEPDTTTVMAALITYVLGYMLWFAHSLLPAALAISVTA